jgi:fatty acid desaturase
VVLAADGAWAAADWCRDNLAIVGGETAQRSFRVGNILSTAEIKELTRASNLRGAWVVLANWLWVAAAFALVARWPTVPSVVGAILVIGSRQLAFVMLTHEAAHGMLFRTRRLNAIVGPWLCSNWIWIDLPEYRRLHLQHHNETGTHRDPDLPMIVPFPMSRGALVKLFVRDLIGLTAAFRIVWNILDAFGLIERSPDRIVAVNQRGRTNLALVTEAWRRLRGIVLTHAVLIAALASVGHLMLYPLWWIAWATAFNAFARVRGIVEHACTPDPDDLLRQTRTTLAPFWERMTVAPLNINYHIEHHLLMTVPFFRLPSMHRLLKERGAFENACISPNFLAALEVCTTPGSRPATIEQRLVPPAGEASEHAAPTTAHGSFSALPWVGMQVARVIQQATGRPVQEGGLS